MTDDIGLKGWVKIGFVPGHGNSNSPKQYSFVDDKPVSGNAQYRLKQIDLDGKFKYSKTVSVSYTVPAEFKLYQNYPNPFNPSTSIKFTVPESGHAVLNVYNSIGMKVKTLFSGNASTGSFHKVVFDGKNLASGIYMLQLKFGGKQIVKKMLLMK